MVGLFTHNILPVVLAAAAGYVLAWRMKVDPRPVSHAAFYVFAPCLVFRIILDSALPGDALLRMAAFTTLSLLLLAGATALVARRLGWSRPLTAAVVLVVFLPNAGNFGLSVSLFSFGEPGLAQASVFFLTSSVLTFTLGVAIASLGRSGPRETLRGMLRVPAIWAVLAALVVARAEWALPVPVDRTLELLAQATIPVFLVLLGMQLYGKGLAGPWGPVAFAGGMRLLGGAAVGLLLANGLGLADAARQAAVLQSAMPSAVITIVLATEYDAEPALVTSVVIATTLVCPLTLTPLLAWLGA